MKKRFLLLASTLAFGAFSPAFTANDRPGVEPSDDYSGFIDKIDGVAREARPAEGGLAEAFRSALAVESRVAAPEVWVETQSAQRDYLRRDLTVRTEWSTTEAIQLLPRRSRAKRAPAVLIIHGNTSGPEDAFQRWGKAFAKAGYVVLIPRQVGAGTPHEFDDAFNLVLLGRTLAGLRVMECSAMLDHLASVPGVDQERFGLLGEGTGALTAAFTAAVDRRVKAAAVSAVLQEGLLVDAEPLLFIPGLYRVGMGDALSRAMNARQLFSFHGSSSPADVVHHHDRAIDGGPVPRMQTDFVKEVERWVQTAKNFSPAAHDDALEQLGKGLETCREGDPALAEDRLEKAMAAGVESVQALGCLARIFERRGRWGEAERSFRRLAQLRPASGIEVAEFLQRRGRIEEAWAAYAAWIAENPGDLEARVTFAALMPIAEREDYLLETARLYGDSELVLVSLCDIARERGDIAAERARLSQVLALNHANAGVLERLAEVEMHRKDWMQARKAYESVLELKPRHLRARLGLAALAMREGRWEAAKKHWNDILVLDGGNVAARLELADFSFATDDFQAARTYAQQVLNIRNSAQSIRARHLLAAMDQKEGDWRAASAWYREILEFAPHDIRARSALIRCLEKIGDREAVRREIAEGRRWWPDFMKDQGPDAR